MRTIRPLAALVSFLTITVGAWGSKETVLYDFAGGNDGSYPLDYGRLARDSSGNLFGTTQFGGSCSQGTVFRLSPNSSGGWSETVLHTFCGGADGSVPTGAVVLDLAGNIYGTTTGDGNGTCGTVFALSATALNTLHSFDCGADGGKPVSGPTRTGSGNLYGTASTGGANGWGVVYEISEAGQFSVLYSFCQLANCADGAAPSGGLAVDSQGNLYGTTFNGGDPKCVYAAPGCGTVYQLSRVGSVWHEHVLHRFTGGSYDGANPLYASLTLATENIAGSKVFMIFGVTSAGGKNGGGTVFQMVHKTSGYGFKVLHSFTCCFSDGAMPEGTLLLSSGHLIGTTSMGGNSDAGSVFELSLKNGVWTETILYSFINGADGGHPYSGVVADTHGNLYGVASSDGGEFGAVYELTP
jgi:uncharacterized repeat protein (TIGR03803 family)